MLVEEGLTIPVCQETTMTRGNRQETMTEMSDPVTEMMTGTRGRTEAREIPVPTALEIPEKTGIKIDLRAGTRKVRRRRNPKTRSIQRKTQENHQEVHLRERK